MLTFRRFLTLCLTLMALVSVHAQAGGTKAINFKFTDIAGKTVQLSDFKGQWVLVNFWAPWCPLCWVEVPTLNDLNKRNDFVVIGIGLDYGPDENVVRDTASQHSLDFHSIVAGGARRNPDSPFRQVGPVDFYPTSYLYDPDGEIVMFIPGQVRMGKIISFIDSYKRKTSETTVADLPPPAAAFAPTPVKETSFSKPEAAISSPSPAAVKTKPQEHPARKPQKPKTVTY